VGLVETLLMIERPRLNLLNAVVTIAVQAVAALLLIPQFGPTGAAIAMVLGLSTQGLLRFRDVRRVFGWSWPWFSLARPLMAFGVAFVPAAAVHVLDAGLAVDILSGALFLALYALMWTRLGADPEDRDVWRRLTASWPRG
jgi:O-antigen/teichoic acid export membrane protein